MTAFTQPNVGIGETLNTLRLVTPVVNAALVVTDLEAENLKEESVGRYQLKSDVTDGTAPILWNKSAIQDDVSAELAYGSTSFAIINHSGINSSLNMVSAIPAEPGYAIRTHFRAMVSDVSVDAAHYDEDQYFFRWGYEAGGLEYYPSGDWGFSMLARNSGGTFTLDSPVIDTGTYDQKNFIKMRHVDLMGFTLIPAGATRNITRVFWQVGVQNANNSVTIREFSASAYIYQL